MHEPKIRYGVAMSLDGYIAGPNGEFDWIPEDTGIDFVAMWAQFDVFLMGRRTWDIARISPEHFAGKKVFVASRNLRPGANSDITVVPDLTKQALQALRQKATKDIWLFGGSELATTVFNLDEVDGLDLSVIPVLLGAGIPLAPHLEKRAGLRLLEARNYPSGVVQLSYSVSR
jgi:dihydrofolate reductase